MICYAFESEEGGLSAPLPEVMVLEGFRHWLAGYASGKIQPWECLRMTYEDLLGPRTARGVVSELGNWVRTISEWKQGGIQFSAMGEKTLTRDEDLAVALVSAAQHGDEFSGRQAARQLVGEKGELAVLLAANDFAMALRTAEQILNPVSVHESAKLLFEIPFQNQGVSRLH